MWCTRICHTPRWPRKQTPGGRSGNSPANVAGPDCSSIRYVVPYGGLERGNRTASSVSGDGESLTVLTQGNRRSPAAHASDPEALAGSPHVGGKRRPAGTLSVIVSGGDGMTRYQHRGRRRSRMLKPHGQLCMNCWRARLATMNDAHPPEYARHGIIGRGQTRNLPRPSPSVRAPVCENRVAA